MARSRSDELSGHHELSELECWRFEADWDEYRIEVLLLRAHGLLRRVVRVGTRNQRRILSLEL